MAALKEINFRKLYHKTSLFIDRTGRNLAVMKRAEFPVRPDDNAILVYGYIDHTAGLSFEVLCAAYVYEDGQVSLEPGGEHTSLKLRFDSFRGEVVPFDNIEMLLPYQKKIEMIDEGYGCSDDIMEVRSISALDPSRAPGYPDDILVYFVGESEKAEGIWCRVERVDHDKGLIYANLLNQPYRSYGYNMGDTVPVGLIKMEDGELKAAAILQ